MTPGAPEGQRLDPPGLSYCTASACMALTLTHFTSVLNLANIP